MITLALLLLGAVVPAMASAGTISGTVTDAVTKEPIEGLQVCAFAFPEDGNVSHCATTDANGEYMITELLVHGYRVILYGEPLGYKYQVYNEELGYFNEAIPVGSEPVTGIDVEMHPFGRIEGVVSEADSGTPVEGIRVCAWVVAGNQLGNCVYSAADGTYTIRDVRPGEYTIEFLGVGNLLSQTWGHEEQENWWEGAPLSVQLSEVVTGIDAELASGARVEGTVRYASGGAPLKKANVCALLPSGMPWRCGQPDAEGHYLVQGLATGNYLIQFTPVSQGLQVQYWDHQANIAKARTLSLTAGTTTTGIDADVLTKEESWRGGSSLPMSPVVPSPPQPSHHRSKPSAPHKCRKGFHKKSVHGKVRCVQKQRGRHQNSRSPRR
ncbi:MAG: MSCRAMM family protein [Solirubrobacterales bacterium]